MGWLLGGGYYYYEVTLTKYLFIFFSQEAVSVS